jgi:hypothetical protein
LFKIKAEQDLSEEILTQFVAMLNAAMSQKAEKMFEVNALKEAIAKCLLGIEGLPEKLGNNPI